MILGLTIHLLGFLLLGIVIDLLFGRWNRRQRVSAGMALGMGVALLIGRLGWLFFPFINPQPPIRLSLTSSQRLVEFWWGWTLTIALVLLVGWGLARSWWALRQLKAFRDENPLEGLEVGCPEFFKAHLIRMNLEKQYRRYAQAPTLAVRFSWLTLSPLIAGMIHPTLFLPMPLLEEHQDAFLEPIMDHEAGHIRLRHHWIYAPLAWLARLMPFLTSLVGSIGWAMIMRVDRDIREKVDETTWKRYVGAIQGTVPTQVDWSPALAIPHCARDAEGRIRQISGLGSERSLFQIGLMLWLFFSGVQLSASVGQVSINNIKEFLVKNQITGYDVRIWDPQVRLQALPGKGGRLPDGVVLDASKATGKFQTSFMGVNLRPLLPPEAEAARVSFNYEAWDDGGAPGELPTVSTRAMEYSIDEKAGKHHSWIFDFRWKPLAAGKGKATLSMRLHGPERRIPASADKLVGPDIAVPAGWRLAISDWEVEAIPASEVAPTAFPGDVEGFVTVATNCHRPSPLHLSW